MITLITLIQAMAYHRLLCETEPRFIGNLDIPQTRVLRMPWQDHRNGNDCAIFTMKHMETYQGSDKDWEIGIDLKKVMCSSIKKKSYPLLILIKWKKKLYTNIQMTELFQKAALSRLRVEYCGTILTHKANELRNEVNRKALQWAKDVKLKL